MTVPVTLVPFFILLRTGVEPPQSEAEEPEREEQRDEQMENLRLRILMETMDVLYFQWDIQEGCLRASANWSDTMGYEPTIVSFEEGELRGRARAPVLHRHGHAGPGRRGLRPGRVPLPQGGQLSLGTHLAGGL